MFHLRMPRGLSGRPLDPFGFIQFSDYIFLFINLIHASSEDAKGAFRSPLDSFGFIQFSDYIFITSQRKKKGEVFRNLLIFP